VAWKNLRNENQEKGAAMRLSFLICCGMVLAAGPSLAAEPPIGEWLVADGYAQVRIENCGGALWGVVSWEQKAGRDTENPDPALRSRPTLGMPILLDMKEKESTSWGEKTTRWEGQIYNSQNGKTYEGNIRLLSPNVMKLEGCVLGGIFCGGQEWTRVNASTSGTSGQAKGSAPKAANPKAGPTVSDVCSRLVNVPGRAH
jgi:uncharacterized protein (DUF2147 family)